MTSDDTNIKYNILMEYPFDITWTDYLQDVHDNPKKYDSSWKEETYGNPNYLKEVIDLCTNCEVNYICDGEYYSFNLSNGHKNKLENTNDRKLV